MDTQPTDTRASCKRDDAMASRSSGVDCVFLSCFDHNAQFFASMLGPGGIRLHRACTVEMADFLLLATRGTVLVSDTTFLDGSWEDALAMTRTVHPLVATVICADLVDSEFVAMAQERGAFEVLWRPVELEQLRSRIRAADELTRERRLWLAERGRGHERQSDQKFVPEFQWKR